MAPSPALEGNLDPEKVPDPADKPSAKRIQQETASALEREPPKEGKAKTVNGTKGQQKPVDKSKDGQVSGKEKKEKAKAEKAARRAQDKQKQQGQPVADLQGGNQVKEKKEGGRRSSTTTKAAPTVQTGQHKRTGSTNSKTLPVRPLDSQAAPVSEEPQKEEKKVALLDHLYGLPRRTTLSGAGKDVHPAVLALGLQMSNYMICGSTARCAATLLVFRIVCHFGASSRILFLTFLGN